MEKQTKKLFLFTWIFNLASFLMASTWNSAFETTPANTQSLALGATRVRELKDDVRKRLAVEMCFGTGFTGSATNCTTADDGRMREGSARAFFQATAPTVLPVDDFLAINDLDDGRILVDSDTNDLYVYDATALAWERIYAVPIGAIVMYDNTTSCPTGWTIVSTMNNRIPVGTDVSSANANIPDTSGQTGGAETHTHTGTVAANTDLNIEDGGGGNPHVAQWDHTHTFTSDATTAWLPFRTVIFCKKD